MPAAGCAAAAIVVGVVVYELAARSTSLVGHNTHAPMVMLGIVLLPAAAVAVLGDARIGVLSVFAAFPIGFTPLPGGLVDVIQGAIVGVSALVLLSRLRAAGSFPWSPAYWWLLAIVVWTLVGVSSSVDPGLSFRRLLVVAIEVVFATTVIAACKTRQDVRLLVLGLLIAVGFAGMTTIGQAKNVQASFGGSVVSGRATGMFSEPNQLGSFTATAALAGIGLVFAASSTRKRIAPIVLSGVAVIALLLSLSRGAWIGFGVGMLVLTISVPSARRLLVVSTAALFVIALAFGALAPQSPQVQVVGDRFRSLTGEKNPYDTRPQIWAEARREIRADPLTGHGLGTFPIVAQRSTSRAHTAFPPHAHNLYLNWGAETGIPNMVFIGAFAIHLGVLTSRAMRRMRRERRDADAALLGGLAAASAVVLGQGLFDYTLWSTVVFTETIAVVGLFAAMLELERS